MPDTDLTRHCREWPSMAAMRDWAEGLGLMDWELAEFDGLASDIESDVEGMRRRMENMVRIAATGGGNLLETHLSDQQLERMAFPAAYAGKPHAPAARPEQGTGDSLDLQPGFQHGA